MMWMPVPGSRIHLEEDEYMNEIRIDEKKARATVIGSILMTTFTMSTFMAFPVFVVPLTEKLGVSVGQVMLIFSCAAIVSMITAMLIGTLLKKFKVKMLLPISSLFLVAFFIVVALTKSITLIYVAALFYGITIALAGLGITQTEIMWWYAKGSGKMMGFIGLGIGVAGMVGPILVAKLMDSLGFETVSIALGVVVGIIIVLLSLFMISEHPSVYGLQPVGYDSTEAQGAGHSEEGKTVKQIVSSLSFWLIILAVVFVTLATTGFGNNASALYQNKGLSPVQAAMMISIAAGIGIIMSVVFGILVDKIGPVKASVIYGLGLTVIFAVATTLSGFVGCLIIAIGFSLNPMVGIMGPVTLGMLFGRKESGSLVGFTTAASSLGQMLGAPIAGFMFDASKSYNNYLFLASGLVFLTIIFVIVGGRKKSN
jgi:predicted MFS family arabinose efflux permease